MNVRGRVLGVVSAAAVVTGLLSPAGTAVAIPPAEGVATASLKQSESAGLGNGLGRLLDEAERPSESRVGAGLRIDQEALAIRDDAGRVLIDVTPRAGVDRVAFAAQLVAAGMVVEATDPASGTIEGFLDLAAVRSVLALPGTGTIAQALKPQTSAGEVTSQGVALERVDAVQAAGVDGTGITIGALSDSYDTAATDVFGEPLEIHAEDDIASGDLPGPGNPANPRPVVVLEDLEEGQGIDEGRAMLQILHDVAPGADLCFASAFTAGFVGFAQSIRDLADPAGRCQADVIVDDVFFLEEPFFSDSVINDAIDDVAASGAHYFTSAGNDGHQGSWDAAVDLLPARSAATAVGLDLTGVDPALYAGGLQDMDPGSGEDVAQTITLSEQGGLLDLQWDDPVDLDGPTLGEPILSDAGEITDAEPAPTFTFEATADQVGSAALVRVDAIPSGSLDLILSVTAPDGTELGPIDTLLSPESLFVELTLAGTYTITVTEFLGDEGAITVDVLPVVGPTSLSTDFNVLVFDADGRFQLAIAEDNLISGRPFEIGYLVGLPEVQIAIARADTGPVQATRLRNILFFEAFVTEYSDPLAPAMFGHQLARGATAVAAFDPFRPYLPENFTSPGGDLPVFFDSAGARYESPQVRRVPHIAAADGVNTTFFAADTPLDPDSRPNFFGTSASAPHAAGIAALVLEGAGGPGSLAPADLRRRLQDTAFDHDLDPNHAEGTSGGLTITADGAQGDEFSPIPGSMTDPEFFTVSYSGAVPLRSVTLFGRSGSPTAAGLLHPPLSDGIVFDPRPFDGTPPFVDDGFPFTVGSTTGGLDAASVSATFRSPAAVEGQYRRMTVHFQNGLRAGQSVSFGVDRDSLSAESATADQGNGADELGGAVFVPRRVQVPVGVAFLARRTDGSVAAGLMSNRLGSGWTPLDGSGLIDAEKAVLGR